MPQPLTMPLEAGRHIGAYQVVALLGAGGMGEVYRAWDSRLKRSVALKVLPDEVTHDRDRLSRFRREAEMLAALNHPHIAHVYGVEDNAIVMELVEGETLAERVRRGPLRIDEAIAIATQIADALETAHDAGIVHRDLKPANIKIDDNGSVKVLDFGLARNVSSAPDSDALNSPTITSPATIAGVILGTAAYMSPEQARGRIVDKRTDVWAFGCVLYEMLTGARAFGGQDVTETIAAVIRGEPDMSRLPAATPPHISALIDACLQKDRGKRLGSMSAAKVLLHPPVMTQPPTLRAVRPVGTIVTAALIGGIAIGAAAMYATRPRMVESAARPIRFDLTDSVNSRTGSGRDIAISSDGTHVAMIGQDGFLYVRDLATADSTRIDGSVGVRQPFFSPDGRWIAFFQRGTELKKAPVAGGNLIKICDLNGFSRGGAWLDDDSIVFASANQSGLQLVSANGGTPASLTTPQGSLIHAFPSRIAGRNAVLFTVIAREASNTSASTALLDLTTKRVDVIWQGGSDARYLEGGYLVFASRMGVGAATVAAMRFDLDHPQSNQGAPVTVVSDVSNSVGAANYDVSANGTLVYEVSPITAAGPTSLIWVSRDGREESMATPLHNYLYPRVSPDGTLIALDIREETSDIWTWDIARRLLTKVTTYPGVDRFPAWMPDSKTIVYTSDREKGADVFMQRIGGGEPVRVTNGTTVKAVMAVAPDGKSVIYRESAPTFDLKLVSVADPHEERPLIATPSLEANAVISRDGRWIAYESDESGRFEIYVRPYPDVAAGKWQVSADGATQPLWSRNGRELFFIAADGAFTTVPIGTGAAWNPGRPVMLFKRTPVIGSAVGGGGRIYDEGTDGRFVFSRGTTSIAIPPVSIIVNWSSELRQLTEKK